MLSTFRKDNPFGRISQTVYRVTLPGRGRDLARGGGASRLFIPLQPNSDDDEFGGSSLKIEVCRKIVFVIIPTCAAHQTGWRLNYQTGAVETLHRVDVSFMQEIRRRR